MARFWTCRKCQARWPRTKKNCATLECGGTRPKPRRAKHKRVLDIPYEAWAEVYGETCNICGREARTRKLDRDHCHATGEARGLLCSRCNRAIPNWMTAEWTRKATDYLSRDLPQPQASSD